KYPCRRRYGTGAHRRMMKSSTFPTPATHRYQVERSPAASKLGREIRDEVFSTRVAAGLPRRLVDDGVIPSERRVQRPPRVFLHGPPRRRRPMEHLTDPRVEDVIAVEERRAPSVPVVGQRQVVAVPLHPD